MKADATLKAQLGGACDLTGDAKFNEELSLKRAENARAYLTSKGIDASRIEVQNYSFDWARVEAERGNSEGKNRRVQIWLHKQAPCVRTRSPSSSSPRARRPSHLARSRIPPRPLRRRPLHRALLQSPVTP
jgi:hypothetical protein